MNRSLLALVACLACSGCKPKRSEASEALERVKAFWIDMCNCKDKECADKVQERMTAWGTEAAKNATKAEKPDPEVAKKVGDFMMKYTECYTKVAMSDPGSSATAHAGSLPPMPAPPLRADALIKVAREHAAKRDKNLVVSKLDVRYVRADGTLDPKHGELLIALRTRPIPLDDPKRPIGAPLPEPAQTGTECPTWSVAAGAWSEVLGSCNAEQELVAKCSVEQVWARALKDDAPAAALATLALGIGDDDKHTPFWQFSIVDNPRNISIHKIYTDDCTPIVERQ